MTFESIKSPFPSHVAFVSLHSGAPQKYTLLPAEELLLTENAVEKRRLEFTLGRNAARLALEALGVTPAPPILRGPQREPLWPENIVGSITHTKGSAAAAVAWSKHSLGIGLDIESLEGDRKQNIQKAIAQPEELRWIESDPAHISTRTLAVFSAKEAVYKALYPLCKKYFGFDAVTLTRDEQKNEFGVVLGAVVKELLPKNSPLQEDGVVFVSSNEIVIGGERFVMSSVLLPGSSAAQTNCL